MKHHLPIKRATYNIHIFVLTLKNVLDYIDHLILRPVHHAQDKGPRRKNIPSGTQVKTKIFQSWKPKIFFLVVHLIQKE